MRRVAFISDLHANLVAVDAVLADIDQLGVDEIVCLGDIVDLGPQPCELLDRLHEREVRCIRGNHDTLDEHPPHHMLLEIETWTQAQLGEARLRELAELPEQLTLEIDSARVLCVHGSPRDDTDQVLASTTRDTLVSWIGDHEFDVMVGGHTHVQLLRRLDARLIVNVGSVGMPFERAFDGGAPKILPWCEYGVISGADGTLSVDLRRVPLDLERFAASVRESSMPGAARWVEQWLI
ncbi:serine/threonine protein phosphatase [Enhygromyxa salina]|uniref:Phosphoesterase n=1 Tax=Enhygromyxa salina TaxID=215803 RepID=A0A0C2CMD6_9BACT|nr:YfcE family phosphodiesterase [Enhygromyxa salina]KIG12426.1 serine/threonine protein phosphatase [Enhygromyxa salina]